MVWFYHFPRSFFMLETSLDLIVTFVKEFGYTGIFFMTFLESSFLPIPSEITMIPAGYLISKGEMNAALTLLCSTAGTVCGACFNYWIAERFGLRFIARFGHYFGISAARLKKIEDYFHEHGPISIFTGRLIPGLRHFISLPAGIARMHLRRFIFYTATGGGIWMATLLVLGFVIGENEALLKKYLLLIKVSILLIIAAIISAYVWQHRIRKRRRAHQKKQ